MPFKSKRKMQSLCGSCKRRFIKSNDTECLNCNNTVVTPSLVSAADTIVEQNKICMQNSIEVETVNEDSDSEDQLNAMYCLDDSFDVIDMFGERANLPRPCIANYKNPVHKLNNNTQVNNMNVTDVALNDSEEDEAEESSMSDEHYIHNAIEDCSMVSTTENPMSETSTIKSEDLTLSCCENCHRKQQPLQDQASDIYGMKIIEPCLLQVNRCYRLFCTISRKDFTPAEKEHGKDVNLCITCKTYLLSEETDNSSRMVWPAYLWSLLTDKNLAEKQASKLWSLIPSGWRSWWIDELKTKFGHAYNHITLSSHLCLTRDVTSPMSTLKGAIKKGKLLEIKDACDEHLYPLVKCPWGCTEYYHKSHMVNFDAFIDLIFNTTMLKKMKRKKNCDVKGVLPDFLTSTKIEYLLNAEEWPILPSLVIDEEKGLQLLVCRNHEYGEKGRMIHVPSNPTGWLASKTTDNLAPAVVSCRQIKPVRANKYSTTYSM